MNRQKLQAKIILTTIFGIFVIIANLTGIEITKNTILPANFLPTISTQAATTAIAVPISESIGGVASITAFTVIFNGVLTYALGKMALRYFRIKDEIAQGLSLGAAGHALGVAVSMELGETETAMASIAVVIVGLVTVVVVPIFAPFIGI